MTQMRSGRGMGEEANERAAGMIPPARTTTISASAIAPRQIRGERRSRSTRRRNVSRSQRRQKAAGKALQQKRASSSFWARLSRPDSARKLHQCQVCSVHDLRHSVRCSPGTIQLASQTIDRQLQNILCNGPGKGMVPTTFWMTKPAPVTAESAPGRDIFRIVLQTGGSRFLTLTQAQSSGRTRHFWRGQEKRGCAPRRGCASRR